MRRLKNTLLSVVVISTLMSCGGMISNMAEKNTTPEKKGIPYDYGKNDEYMLFIIKGKDSYDKYLKKHVEENYKGKYKYVLMKDLEKDEFKDKSVYRYTFTNEISSYRRDATAAYGTAGNLAVSSQFYIYDRLEGKNYSPGIASGLFSANMRGCIRGIEKERSKNSK